MNRIEPYKIFGTELSRIEKPSRYLGSEIGAITKPNATLKIALCFPDLYEIGMANNAMRILYANINKIDDISCERVFSVASDYELLLNKNNIPLYSLETGLPLASFDILAFTIGYELAATNILNVMKLGNIPIHATERDNTMPLVIAGGPAITNPIPYTNIFDAVWIGEAENNFFNLLIKIRDAKKQNADRQSLLQFFKDEKSVWMPNKKATRNIFMGFDNAPTLYNFPSPTIKPVQDHGVVEIMRGCPNGCRFCHAGYYYRPQRLRWPDKILDDVDFLIRQGFSEISLSSLSSGDYPSIVKLLSVLNKKWASDGVSFQLPSLKIESFPMDVIEEISGVRKGGLTFAIETPLHEWQCTINKNVSIEKIFEILEKAVNYGYRIVKFYFMLGLPVDESQITEELAIVGMMENIIKKFSKININMTLATFVPKPHTPFQYCEQINIETAQKKIFFIKDSLRKYKNIKITYHSPFLSWLEGIIARGDERVGESIITAFESGARFDAWDDKCNKEIWKDALSSVNQTGMQLWEDQVSLGVYKKYFLNEYNAAIDKKRSSMCMKKCTSRCGVCSDAVAVSDHDKIITRIDELYSDSIDSPKLSRNVGPVKYRLLFKYKKLRNASFLPHHELMDMLSRAFVRIGLPVVYSNGFNPSPRIEITEPLTLGFESYDEYGVIALGDLQALPDKMISSISDFLHKDLEIIDYKLLPTVEGRRFVSLSAMHWGSLFCIDFFNNDHMVFVNYINSLIFESSLLKNANIKVDNKAVELLLPFTGKREFGLSGLFESAYSFSVRDTKLHVARMKQFAKSGDGAILSYFDAYQ